MSLLFIISLFSRRHKRSRFSKQAFIHVLQPTLLLQATLRPGYRNEAVLQNI